MLTRRLLALVTALLLFGQAIGFVDLAMADECERRCAKDDPNQQPEPGCDLCPCCARPHPALPVGAALHAILSDSRVALERQPLPTAPDPNDIPHVPKLVA